MTMVNYEAVIADNWSKLLTYHAAKRATQRGLARAISIKYVLDNGTLLRRTGCDIYFLSDKDVQGETDSDLRKLVGTTVIVGKNDSVVTVYRNPARGMHLIKRKKPRRSKLGRNNDKTQLRIELDRALSAQQPPPQFGEPS